MTSRVALAGLAACCLLLGASAQSDAPACGSADPDCPFLIFSSGAAPSACPANSVPNEDHTLCYTTCPAGTAPDPADPAACFAACKAGFTPQAQDSRGRRACTQCDPGYTAKYSSGAKMYRCYKGAAIRKANVTFVARATRRSVAPGCPAGTEDDGEGRCTGCSALVDPSFPGSYAIWSPRDVALCVPEECCLEAGDDYAAPGDEPDDYGAADYAGEDDPEADL